MSARPAPSPFGITPWSLAGGRRAMFPARALSTIVMIDDFKVPADARFGWDGYDDEREICLQHIEGTFGDGPVHFPNYPAEQEGDVPPRGYCVIATSPALPDALDGIPLLKRHAH